MIKTNEELLEYLREAKALAVEIQSKAGTANLETSYIGSAIEVVSMRIAYLKKTAPAKPSASGIRDELLAKSHAHLAMIVAELNADVARSEKIVIPPGATKVTVVDLILTATGYSKSETSKSNPQ